MTGEGERTRFVADSMLGRLAKSLRMLGFDVAYDPFADDGQLLAQARDEGRIVLTRDTQMVRRRKLAGGPSTGSGPPLRMAGGPSRAESRGGELPRLVFIVSDHLREQLAQVARELGLPLDRSAALTRCIVCNGDLSAVPKESVRGEVPPYVHQTQDTFARCGGCGRIYWRGTHVEAMERKLDELAVAAGRLLAEYHRRE